MIRKTAFLVTGTVTGLVAVLSYNPPKLNSAIAASGTTTLPTTNGNTNSSTSTNAQTQSTNNSPAQPAPATTKSSKATSASKSSSTSTASNSSSTSTTTENNTSSSTQSSAVVTPQKQSASTSGTYKGETIQTRWGPVQVQITVSNGKIADISTLQYPNGDRHSQMISSQVIPWLQQEALQAQSANISGIGGATYTSGGFINSLASALQKAGL